MNPYHRPLCKKPAIIIEAGSMPVTSKEAHGLVEPSDINKLERRIWYIFRCTFPEIIWIERYGIVPVASFEVSDFCCRA